MRMCKLLLITAAVGSAAGCASRGGDGPGAMSRTGGAAQAAARETYYGMGEAVTTPFRDLNLTRKEIPVVLLAAMDSPYQTRTAFDCPGIAAEVAALDLALGPDLDAPRDIKDSDYYRIGAEQAAEAALDAVRDAAEGIVPVRGWVRRLSGAQRAEQRTKEAVYAGSVRRAFLKGVGEHRGCAPPAAPMAPLYAEPAKSADEAGQPAASSPPPPAA